VLIATTNQKLQKKIIEYYGEMKIKQRLATTDLRHKVVDVGRCNR